MAAVWSGNLRKEAWDRDISEIVPEILKGQGFKEGVHMSKGHVSGACSQLAAGNREDKPAEQRVPCGASRSGLFFPFLF